MKQQLKMFSPTYGQLTHSIVLSEFGLLTILSKIVLRMCRFCARNFALQGINFPFIGFCDSKIFGRIQNCIVKYVRVVRNPSLDPKLLLKCNKPGHDQDLYRLQRTKGTIHAQAQVIKCTTPRQGLPANSKKLSGFLKVLGMCKFCALFCRNLGHTQVLWRL